MQVTPPPPKEIVKRHSEIKLSCKLRCVKPRLRLPCLKSRRVPPSVVRPCLHGTVYHCQTQNNNFVIRSKMARQLFNVANIKYRCLSYGGHSVRFLNRSGKFIQSSNRVSEMFFFTWCSADKSSPHISAYHLGPWRFMANKHFVKEVRIKVEFSKLSQKGFTTMIQFWKRLSMQNSILSKGLKRPNTKSFKIAGLLWTLLHNLHGQP